MFYFEYNGGQHDELSFHIYTKYFHFQVGFTECKYTLASLQVPTNVCVIYGREWKELYSGN